MSSYHDFEGDWGSSDDEMRRVKFNDVVTVEYDNDESSSRSKTDNGGPPHYSQCQVKETPTDSRINETMSIEIHSSDHDTPCNSDADSSGTTTPHRRDRRQSLAAQIFLSHTKWNQQKDYRQRKMSLHGKPIYFTAPSRRKHRVRKLMILVFNFLERPSGRNWSVLYHVSTFLMVCACLVLTVFVTIPQHQEQAQEVLFYMEIILIVVFSVELLARVWSAGCRSRYQGFIGRMRFLRKPFCVIDVTVVISSFVIILAGNDNNSTFAATAMRGLRFLQILRMVRVDRRGGTWKLLGSVVHAHSKELLTAWYIGFLALIFASFLVYQAEKDENKAEFGTFADALWWGLITLTTIGYGDKTPRSWVGRLVASCFAILGISFFALPAGILGSGFALKVQEQHRQKHFARRRNPAAYLIQCFWRCYAADADSTSTATWQPCLRGFIAYHQPQNKNKASIRGRMTSSKSKGSTDTDPTAERNNAVTGEDSVKEDFVRNAFEKLHERFTTGNRSSSVRKPVEKKGNGTPDFGNSDDDSSTKSSIDVITELTEPQKNAIRGFRMMKFHVAKRKFKEALRPYDVKDVIEQYSSGHIDMLARVKSLQNRVDGIVGVRSAVSPAFHRSQAGSTRSARGYLSATRKFSQSSTTESYQKGLTMHERLMNVENSVAGIERKMDLLIAAFKKQNRKKDNIQTIPEVDSSEGDDEDDDTAEKPFSKATLHSPRPQRRKLPQIADDSENDEVFDYIDAKPNERNATRAESQDMFAASTPLLASCQEYASNTYRKSSAYAGEEKVTIKTTSFSAPNGLTHSAVS